MKIEERMTKLSNELMLKLIDTAWKELETTELQVVERAEVMMGTFIGAAGRIIGAYVAAFEKADEVKEKVLDICIDLLRKETDTAMRVFTEKKGEHGEKE
ncbi:MAG: hypothetical protein DRJ45_07265 [Thermoprotei archaeon]|nr:MAG: hypothetical protein DRJ45_07265 [Thermoprotei archaeon]